MQITRSMTRADEPMFQADDLRKVGAAAKNKLLQLQATYADPQYLRITAACVLLPLILLLPFMFDPQVQKPAIDALLATNYGTRAQNDQGQTGASTAELLYFVFGQTLLVFFLSYVGSAKTGIQGIGFRGAGLLAAVAIPTMAILTTLAQASTTSILRTLQSGGSTTPPTWLDAVKDNSHILVFAVFSALAHFLIWATAPHIVESLEALIIILRKKWLASKAETSLRKAEGLESRSSRIVVSILNADRQLVNAHPDQEFDFRYVTSHPRVAEMIERHKRNVHGPDDHGPDDAAMAAAA